jgi:hypothetical protein
MLRFSKINRVRVVIPRSPTARHFILSMSQATRLEFLRQLIKMSMFRAKKFDLGCFAKIKTIRDHTKRKVYEEFEPQRCVDCFVSRPPAGFDLADQ